MVVPTPDELQRMVRKAEKTTPVLGTAIALAALTGCRRGELCALRWADVLGDSLRVARSVSIVGGVTREGPTKTHQERKVALDDIGQAVLAGRLAAARKSAEDAGETLAADGFILSRRADGARPMAPDYLTHAFLGLMGKLGLPYHLHHLRHFTATTAIGAGVDARTVAGRLGHADASTTLRIYAHALEAQDRLAAEALGRALAPPKEAP